MKNAREYCWKIRLMHTLVWEFNQKVDKGAFCQWFTRTQSNLTGVGRSGNVEINWLMIYRNEVAFGNAFCDLHHLCNGFSPILRQVAPFTNMV